MEIKSPESCQFDILSLGEILLRLDPGNVRGRTTRRFDVWEGGGAKDNMGKSVFARGALLSWMFCPTRREPEAVMASDWLELAVAVWVNWSFL